MRPQHITAENAFAWLRRRPVLQASMRPQHITAENDLSRAIKPFIYQSFNEAAAYHCGKRPAACATCMEASRLQ